MKIMKISSTKMQSSNKSQHAAQALDAAEALAPHARIVIWNFNTLSEEVNRFYLNPLVLTLIFPWGIPKNLALGTNECHNEEWSLI